MSEYPSKRTLASLFVVTTVACAGAFFWSTWAPDGRSAPLASMAQAAVRHPMSGARIVPIPVPRAMPVPPSKPATKAESAAVKQVVSAQLKAFNEGNWKEAAKYQSAGLKQQFPTPEVFGEMIQKTYPAFIHPKKVAFGPATNTAGHIQMEVDLTTYDGQVTKALYSLSKEKAGYRIDGVMGGATPQPMNSTVA